MKKLFLLTIIILLFSSCTPIVEYLTEYIYVEPEQEEYDSELFGTWVRGYFAWEFLDNGRFMYYNYITLEVFTIGFYVIDHDSGTIYLEEYFTGAYALYDYLVMENYPIYGTITLRWDIGDYEKVIE